MDGLTAAAAVAGAASQACEYALGAPERPRPFEWRLEEPLFWHMNRLVMPIEVDSALLQLAPAADRVRQRFAAMDRSVPRILWFDLLNGRPLEETRQALEYLMDQAAEAKAKLRLSSPVDLLRHASAARRLASSAEALALADEILRGAQNRLPDYIRAGQRYFSLAETFQALADGLAFYRERQVLPASIEIAGALGPVGEKTELAPSEAFQALGSEILAAAEAAAAQMAQSRPARPPATLRLGEHRVNAAQFLVAMAWTWRWAASGREIEKAQVPVNAISMATALGDRLEERLKPGSENPAWFAKMQLWSLRPCPLPD
ncbi:MAG: hypothetical protein BWZ10_01147 [candidate division BRC1 bacterium ADurb.BinA364]|nr:MAG: hypothetical protein BWZ10_01147 [candidate division BRC1 bacterium ADurb.BinA364]